MLMNKFWNANFLLGSNLSLLSNPVGQSSSFLSWGPWCPQYVLAVFIQNLSLCELSTTQTPG